jgi:hypothetical protein
VHLEAIERNPMTSPMPLRRSRESREHLSPAPLGAAPGPLLIPVPPLPDPLIDEGDDIPDPSPGFVRALAVQGFEVLEGIRTVAQLGPLVSLGVARRLTAMRAARNERRAVYRDERRRVPRAAGVRIDRHSLEAAEAAVVLHVDARVHAVAMRLEWAHRHWRAADLTVL